MTDYEIAEIGNQIVKMNLLEIKKLDTYIGKVSGVTLFHVDEPEDHPIGSGHGVDRRQPHPMFQVGSGVEEEPPTYDVVLNNYDHGDNTYFVNSVTGSMKIQTIKEVRALLGTGLKESKDFVESLPRTLKENISREEANRVEAAFMGVGAQTTITRRRQ